jgi:hypothetical protein
MSEQSTGVAPGTLSGINLSGEPDEQTLPPDDERTTPVEEIPEPQDEPTAPQPPQEEPQEEPQPPEEAPQEPMEPVKPPKGSGKAKKTKKAAAAKGTGAPVRPYVVLREDAFEDGSKYAVVVHEVEARNAQNAMRQAFKDLSDDNADEAEATLIVIPKSMYRPTRVRMAKTERVSVQFG